MKEICITIGLAMIFIGIVFGNFVLPTLKCEKNGKLVRRFPDEICRCMQKLAIAGVVLIIAPFIIDLVTNVSNDISSLLG